MIEESSITFISHVNGALKGPVLELHYHATLLKLKLILDFTYTSEDLILFLVHKE